MPCLPAIHIHTTYSHVLGLPESSNQGRSSGLYLFLPLLFHFPFKPCIPTACLFFLPFCNPTGHRSSSPHLHRREYDYDAEGETTSVQMPTSANTTTAFTASSVAKTPSAPPVHKRGRPSRFYRPAAPTQAPPAPAPVPVPITNNVASGENEDFSRQQHPRLSRNHGVYVPADISRLLPVRRGERDRDELTSSTQISSGGTNSLIDKRMRHPSHERGDHAPLSSSGRGVAMARGPGANPSAPGTSPPPSESQSQERGLGQSRTCYTTFQLLLHTNVSPSLPPSLFLIPSHLPG